MQKVKPYSQFAKIYSHLMNFVDYKFWAEYISEIHETIGNKNDIALEIASGNCKLSKYLDGEFSKLYLSDLSASMLKLNKPGYDSICCNMLNLPFKNKFDFIYSAFDSINYLATENEFETFFHNIPTNLTENGYFLFDVSLIKNSLKYVKQLNREGVFRGIKYKQVSKVNKKKKIHSNILTIQLKDGSTFQEEHIQKIYDFYYYFDVIESAGLVVAECFDAFTFNDCTEDSERIQFIVKRKD